MSWIASYWRRTNGVQVQYFPRTHNIEAVRWDPAHDGGDDVFKWTILRTRIWRKMVLGTNAQSRCRLETVLHKLWCFISEKVNVQYFLRQVRQVNNFENWRRWTTVDTTDFIFCTVVSLTSSVFTQQCQTDGRNSRNEFWFDPYKVQGSLRRRVSWN